MTGTKLQVDVQVVLEFAKEKKKKPSSQQEKVSDEQYLWSRAPDHRAMPVGERDALSFGPSSGLRYYLAVKG